MLDDPNSLPPDQPPPTFDAVFADAVMLTPTSSTADIKAVLTQAVAAKPSPIETSKLIDAIAAATKQPKKALSAELKQISQQGIATSDAALIVAQKLLASEFNGTHLRRGVDGQYWRYQETHWLPTTDASLSSRLMLMAVSNPFLINGKSVSALVSSAKSCLDHLLGTDEDVMGLADNPLPVINCLNGELWIEDDGSVTLKPHRPESRLTYCLPISYDPKAECPKYDGALSDIFAKAADPAEVVRHWHEFVGYAIQPKRDIPSFWMLIGHGANGKSSLLKTLLRLVGPGAALNESIGSFQKDNFSVATLQGKLLFIDDDVAEGVVLADGLLKKISETKEITARHIYGKKFSFVSRALVVMAGNSYPTTNDVSDGMIRRVQIFPFDRAFKEGEANPALFPTIWEAELSGVLNRAIAGLQRLRQRPGFAVPVACENALHDFMTHAMPLVAFLDERCDFDPDARVRVSLLRASLKEWAKQQGIKKVPTDKTLKRKLIGLGIKVAKVKGYETVFGLTVLTPEIDLP